MAIRGKVFMSGRSQAVRIPKTLRFSCEEVSMERVGVDGVLLKPAQKSWDEVFAAIDAIPGKFPKRGKQPRQRKRLPIE